ncbi:MAG: C39 family peptidase [Candidatus Bathyarchaeota archaeon]
MINGKTCIKILVLTITLTLIILCLTFISKAPQTNLQIYSGKLEEENLTKIKILDVPFFYQKPWFCSEASASMVLAYYGYNLTQDEINYLGYDRFENMLPLLSNYLGKCYYASLNMKQLKSEIDNGKPVIIRIQINEYLHTVVVVGYDENYLYIHDPAVGSYLKCKPEKLLEVWRQTEFKAIIIANNNAGEVN